MISTVSLRPFTRVASHRSEKHNCQSKQVGHKHSRAGFGDSENVADSCLMILTFVWLNKICEAW